MFIVPAVRRSGRKTYTYYKLVESVRTEKGPRQRTIMSVGKLDGIPPESIKLLGRLIHRRLTGQIRLLPSEAEGPELNSEADRITRMVLQKQAIERADSGSIQVNPSGIEVTPALLLGPVYVGLETWRALDMDRVLTECGFSPRQRRLAMLQVVGRLVSPASELSTSRWVDRTAMSELLGQRLGSVNKDALYRVSDRLWSERERIERHLGNSEQRLFETEETLVLYDLTSTYFEGLAEANPKAQRGYSRDRRGDCKQIVVGMVLDEAGFPRASETWRGETNDNKTLEAMLEQLEVRTGKREGTTVVMDRGIAREENVKLLKSRGYHYIVALPGQSRRRWISEIREADFQTLDPHRPEITGCMKKKDDEIYLIVRSHARVAKDRAIRERFTMRLAQELKKLTERTQAGKLSREKVQERIGRLRQRYQRASRFFTTKLVDTERGVKLTSTVDEVKIGEAEMLDGVYILKTNRTDLDSARLWNLYMMLSRVENSFRYLKTSLGIRPIFHQLEIRADGHIFISILAYHLLHVIEQKLRANADHRSWPTIKKELETHRTMTIRLPGADGSVHHLRVATNVTAAQKKIYRMLGINPRPLRVKHLQVETGRSAENGAASLTT
jgi:transposase